MKIFNWMHRKLHPAVKYTQVSQKRDALGGDEEEKREVLFEGVVMEKEALLLHDVLNGILTIGTFGHEDSFLSQSYSTELEDDEVVSTEEEENSYNVNEEAEEKELQGGEIAAAELMAASEPEPALLVEESTKFKPLRPTAEEEGKKLEMVVQDAEEAERIQELPLLKEDREKRERGRTTLADLFAADHSFMAMDSIENANKGATNDRTKLKQNGSCATNSEKKKISEKNNKDKWTSDTTKANRKLQKLVTKMLKKKIHPELAGAHKAAAAEMHSKDRNINSSSF
ncbi:hypothetical protein Cni_G03881 [Canna indica]|uniref:Protein TILLER ANGLE CONTROL 1 n=1 Tax=Canna indica TaxID=4628 RepID=A0AAQ3JUG1_9LILI|nr:hypothetical protein Cni_G03881 [Canna indica]